MLGFLGRESVCCGMLDTFLRITSSRLVAGFDLRPVSWL